MMNLLKAPLSANILHEDRRGKIMSLFLLTVVVGLIGWGASLVLRSGVSTFHLGHMSIGVSGALLGGFLMETPARISPAHSDSISVLSLLVSFFIALALSLIANLWHRVSIQDDAEMDF
jgi:uncharacterized membrane protein YeaQ/YmgE (transglycosylase-associated protein family)